MKKLLPFILGAVIAIGVYSCQKDAVSKKTSNSTLAKKDTTPPPSAFIVKKDTTPPPTASKLIVSKDTTPPPTKK